MSDCTGGESNAVVRKRNGKRRFRRAHGTKSANIRRIQKPNLHFGLRGIICAAAALFIAFAILFDSAFSGSAARSCRGKGSPACSGTAELCGIGSHGSLFGET